MSVKKIKKLLSISLIVLVTFVFSGCFLRSCFGSCALRSCFNSCTYENGSNDDYEFIPLHSLHLRYTGQLFQNIDNTSPVTFTATPNLRSYPNISFDWYVNNQRQTQSSSPSFTLNSQNQAGEFVVRAIAQDYPHIQAAKTVRVYDDFVMPHFSSRDDTKLFSSISYNALLGLDASSAGATFAQGNPPLYLEWLINYEIVQSSFISNFFETLANPNTTMLEFSPDYAGRFKVQARINGQLVLRAAGADYIELAFRGQVQPKNIAVCLNRYPQVQISWDNRQDILFSITLSTSPTDATIANAKDGKAIIYSTTAGGRFNIAQNKTITIQSLAPAYYADCIFIGGSTAAYNFNRLSQAALPFVRNTYLLGNHFMQSDEDIYDILGYMIVFRPNQTRGVASNGARREFNISHTYISTVQIYIGHNSRYTSDSLLASISSHILFTGRYFFSINRGVNLVPGARIDISIEFIDQLEPNMTDSYVSTQGKAVAAPFRAPQLSQTGWAGNTLPIDYFPVANSVARTSDQLFFAVTHGFNPRVVSGSAAERIYNKAYNALKRIVDESMTKAQRAAAIYDYIMFLVSYDYAMLEIEDTGLAVRHPAFYMEGVFDTGFAVCDGMAKAFAMMAWMLGIETTRVIGPARAGTSGVFGQHAWNKINLYGEWFIVDTTWGIPSFRLGGTNYKLMSQGWFLLNDYDVAGGRIELGVRNNLSSRHNFNWFYGQGRFIHDSSCLDEQIERAVSMLVEEAEEWVRAGRAVQTAYENISTNYFVIEFELAASLMASWTINSIANPLRLQLYSALSASNLLNQNNIRILAGNGTVLVGVR